MSAHKTDLGATALESSECEFTTEDDHNNEASPFVPISESLMSNESDSDPEPIVARHNLRREHLEIEAELEPKLRRCDEIPETNEHKYSLFPCQAPGCIEHFETIQKYEDHYHAKHWHVCGECKKTYPTEHLLGLHVQESHDMFFKVKSEKQPMFECYLQVCVLKFKTPEERFKHCVDDHKFPHTFLHSTSKRDHYPKPKQSKKKRSAKERPTKVTSHGEAQMETADNPHEEEAMETSTTSKKDTISGAQKKTQPKQKAPISQEQSANPKNAGAPKKSMHFQFGHSSAARFVPRFTFAMSKENVGKKKEGGVANADMDLTQVKTALDSLDSVEDKVHEVHVQAFEVYMAEVVEEKIE